MSAHLTPEELRKIAPDVAAREFPEQATNTESDDPPPKPKAQTVPPSFWVALAIALAQFAAFLVLLIKY